MKARTYELVCSMNDGFEQTIRSLKEIGRLKVIPKDSLRLIVVEIEEVRAGANADFAERISDRERAGHTRFGRKRRAYEKRLEDPDDVYIFVQQRENKRKKLGLAPRTSTSPAVRSVPKVGTFSLSCNAISACLPIVTARVTLTKLRS